MSVIIILVIIGVIVAGIFLLAFIWAVKSGQYDDMYSPSVRILFDDDKGIDTKIDNNPTFDKSDKKNTNNNI